MKIDLRNESPLARKDGLVLRDLEDELLVYDLHRDKAHCLNRSAAAVWKHSDGRSTPAQIAASLQQEFGAAFDEAMVWVALEQLGRDHLLEMTLDWPKTVHRLSRREAVRRIGLGAAIALPVVISITAPTPAQAATCRPSNSPCSTPSQCCPPGICQPNSRCL